MPPRWEKATIRVECLDIDVTSEDDPLGCGDTILSNTIGKSHGQVGTCGKMDRILLHGQQFGFEDSQASFDWQYIEEDPDAKHMWRRLAKLTSGVVAAGGSFIGVAVPPPAPAAAAPAKGAGKGKKK